MKRMMMQPMGWAVMGLAAIASLSAGAVQAQVLYSENFDGLTLMDSVNERYGPANVTRVATDPESVPYDNAFSKTGPTGWDVDNSLGLYDGVPSVSYSPSPTVGNAGVPGAGLADYGVNEWEGWSFANKDFWVNAAGDQDRSLFTSGTGTVAVADPDEYFDMPDGDTDNPVGGYYNSGLKSPSIPVVGDGSNFYTLTYDSSWRSESLDDTYGPNSALDTTNNQSAEILAVFDNGQTQVIDGWNSDSSSPNFFSGTPANEPGRQASFLAPAGATSVRLQFNIANAANDWWWAVDNLTLDDVNTSTQVWSENFESVPLGPSENERLAHNAHVTTAEGTPDTISRPDYFTHDTLAGWNIDNSGMPAGTVGNNDVGVYEWEGWSFAPLDSWLFADQQRRGEFTKCVGNCAIADSDEWTDLGDSSNFGPINTVLESPAIDVSGATAGLLRLSFDSSWRPEDAQEALITVDYGDGNGPQPVLHWLSDSAGADFHDTNTNETVSLLLNVPAGASTATFAFAHLGGNNNWWWAIDNVQVSAVPEPASCALALFASVASGLAIGGRRRG